MMSQAANSMMPTDTTSPEAVALTASCRLHERLLPPSPLEYNGTKTAFDRLYRELFVIARDEVSLEVDPVGQVIETWCTFQGEVCEGNREADWFLYH